MVMHRRQYFRGGLYDYLDCPESVGRVDVTVTVIVSDVAGNRVGKSIDFVVVPFCACGFWIKLGDK